MISEIKRDRANSFHAFTSLTRYRPAELRFLLHDLRRKADGTNFIGTVRRHGGGGLKEWFITPDILKGPNESGVADAAICSIRSRRHALAAAASEGISFEQDA